MSLFDYQESHVDALHKAINEPCLTAIDASDTGTGKTYTAAALAARSKWRVAVVCPKAVLISWHRVLTQFNVEIMGISNYELFKGGQWYLPNDSKLGDISATCPYMIRPLDKKSNIRWKELEPDMLFIFDEAHRCKNKATGNAKVLLSLADQPCRKLLLSATIADKPEFFAVFARMLNLINDVSEHRLFLKKLSVGPATTGLSYLKRTIAGAGAAPSMLQLHGIVFPLHGSRMRISDTKDHFQMNTVKAHSYKMDDDIRDEIKRQYAYISAVHTEAEAKELTATCRLAEIVRARQKIEALKVKTMAELVSDHLDNGDSVAVFVNYLDTMALLQDLLGVKCVIKGGQTTSERQGMIDAFNEDRERVIICQIQSGGVGISLHDTIGVHPRVSIISPSWSAQDLVQAFGRIHRAGGKTPCVQKIVYCHDTIEDTICSLINQKILNYSMLNDGRQ